MAKETNPTSSRATQLLRLAGALAAARIVDVLLVGSGLATAAGSATFAGYMVMRGQHAPSVNGMEYLAIFAKPHGAAKPPEEVAPPSPPTTQAIDLSPVGSIAPSSAREAQGYAMVAAQRDFAWVLDGGRIFAIRPGDALPRIGRVNTITRRGDRWVVTGPGGAVVLSMEASNVEPLAPRGPSFARGMIFDGR